MTARSRGLRARIAPLFVAAGLVAGFGPAALAQGPNDPAPAEAPEGSGSGRPLDGYLGTLVLVGLVFFIVGKSARR
jgi:hypothetical protein